MLQKNSIYLLTFLAVALVLTGCSRKVVYSHYEPTPIDGWEKNDTLSFTVVPIRHEGMYLEEVGLRTSGIYPFTGLTLIVEQRATPSGLMRSDTLHARLMDSDGSVQGKGISYFQYNFHLTNLRLQANDTLYVSIRHNMKREILPGISDVGISLERIK